MSRPPEPQKSLHEVLYEKYREECFRLRDEVAMLRDENDRQATALFDHFETIRRLQPPVTE